jgi:hypothetical protein
LKANPAETVPKNCWFNNGKQAVFRVMEQLSHISAATHNGLIDPGATDMNCQGVLHEYCAIDVYDRHGKWADSLIRLDRQSRVLLDMRAVTLFLAGSHCPYFMIRHGHLSGLATPNAIDIRTTRSLCVLARLMGVLLHDHIIEAGTDRFSFREAGLL